MIFAWDVRSSVTYAECRFLSDLARRQNVLEIGSWLGRSTIALASTAERVTAVDWHKGDALSGTDVKTLPEFRSNLERYGVAGRVDVIVARIEDEWQSFAPDTFQGCFIDADHSLEAVERHYGIARAIVQTGGWIAFHDYGVPSWWEGFGVTEFVDRFDLIYASEGTIAVVRAE